MLTLCLGRGCARLRRNSGDITLTVGYYDSTTNSTTLPGVGVFNHGGGARRLANRTSVVVRGVMWNVNPFAYALSSSFVLNTGLATVELLDSNGSPLSVPSDDVSEPMVFTQSGVRGSSVALSDYTCLHFNVTSMQWSSAGMALVGFDPVTQAAMCATVVYSSFAGGVRLTSAPVIVGDGSLKLRYASVVASVCGRCWCAYKRADVALS